MSVVFELEAPYRGAFRLHRLTYGSGGPSVAVVAGVHGNEVMGTHALNLVAGVLRMLRLRGTVHLLPCVNVAGADENRKRWPFDDRDIMAALPGDPDGLPVERIAAAVLDATRAEVCVDVHSGAVTTHELPHVRVPVAGHALELARLAAPPVIWRRSEERFADGLIGAWRRDGRTAFQVRGGRGGCLDAADAREMARVVLRLMVGLGIITHAEPPGPVLDTAAVADLRTGVGGFFVPEVRPGDRVGAGALLGTVREPIGGEPLEEIRAPRAGLVLGLRVYPMVHARELAARVAESP